MVRKHFNYYFKVCKFNTNALCMRLQLSFIRLKCNVVYHVQYFDITAHIVKSLLILKRLSIFRDSTLTYTISEYVLNRLYNAHA